MRPLIRFRKSRVAFRHLIPEGRGECKGNQSHYARCVLFSLFALAGHPCRAIVRRARDGQDRSANMAARNLADDPFANGEQIPSITDAGRRAAAGGLLGNRPKALMTTPRTGDARRSALPKICRECRESARLVSEGCSHFPDDNDWAPLELSGQGCGRRPAQGARNTGPIPNAARQATDEVRVRRLSRRISQPTRDFSFGAGCLISGR